MAGEALSVGFLDYSQEKSTSQVGVGSVTAVSLPGLLSDIADYVAAVDAITIGTITFDSLQAYRTARGVTPPTDVNAQRERVFRVFYQDSLPFFDDPTNLIPNAGFGKQFHFDIPTANFELANLFPVNSDEADLDQAAIATFVTALETMARSPYGGTITVTKIIGTGRNT